MPKRLKQLSDHDLLVAGFTAAKTNQHSLAIEHFREAQRRDPADPFVLIEMARSYDAIQQPEPCMACLGRVGELAMRDPQLLLPLSAAYQAVRASAQALEAAQQAEQHTSEHDAALLRQVELLEKTNALDEAQAVMARAAAGSPRPMLTALQAKLARRRGDDAAAHSILQRLIAELPPTQATLLTHLFYELSAVQDKLGDAAAAMRTLERVKAIHTGTDEYRVAERGRRGSIAQLEGVSARITQADCAAWARQQEEAEPNEKARPQQLAFLLGHPRSGTTLIEQALDAHPDLFSADEMPMFHANVWMPQVLEKEHGKHAGLYDYLCGLAREQEIGSRSAYFEAYMRALPAAAGHQIWLDKNPALTTRLPLIARFFTDAKIVFALRDPRDVVLSAYMQPVGINDWSINWLTLQDTVDYYCFAMQMWLDLRDKLCNPWIEVRYEETVDDLPGQAQRATEFLGLDWQDTQADIQSHVRTKTVHSPTYGDVSEPIYRRAVGRWERYAEFFAPFEKQLAPFVEAFGYL